MSARAALLEPLRAVMPSRWFTLGLFAGMAGGCLLLLLAA